MTAKKKYHDAITPEALSAYSTATQEMYTTAWRHFLAWSKKKRRKDILPTTDRELIAFLEDLVRQGRKWPTIVTHKAAILKAHRRQGFPNPADSEFFAEDLRRLERIVGRHQTQMTGLTEIGVAAITATAHIPRTGRGAKKESPQYARSRADFDLALVHTMRDGLLRSSETIKLLWQDLQTYQDGTGRVLVRRSKTDQAGEGALLYLSRTSISALHKIRAPDSTPDQRIFPISRHQLGLRIKSAAAAAGLPGNYGGHSPRIGMAIDLAQAGTGLPEIQQAGRWQTPEMPALYIRGIAAGEGAVARYSSARGR